MSTERVDFTRGAAERIANAVRRVEQGDRDGTPLRFGKVTEEPRKVFRVCTFGSAAWSKNQTQVVVTKYTPTASFTSLNLFANIGTAAATARNCAIALQGTSWFLIAAEC